MQQLHVPVAAHWPSKGNISLWDPGLGEVQWLLFHGGIFLPNWCARSHRCRIAEMSRTVGKDTLVVVLVRFSKAKPAQQGGVLSQSDIYLRS